MFKTVFLQKNVNNFEILGQIFPKQANESQSSLVLFLQV